MPAYDLDKNQIENKYFLNAFITIYNNCVFIFFGFDLLQDIIKGRTDMCTAIQTTNCQNGRGCRRARSADFHNLLYRQFV